MVRALAVSLALAACEGRTQPAPSSTLPPAKPSITSDAGAGTASFVVTHQFGQAVDFSFVLDGKTVGGDFHAEAGKTTTFSIPTGKLVWSPAACNLSEESERKARIELGSGDVAHVSCWQSDRMGMCCAEKSVERPSTKN